MLYVNYISIKLGKIVSEHVAFIIPYELMFRWPPALNTHTLLKRHVQKVRCSQKQTYRSLGQDREPRDNPHTYGQLIYNKGGKNVQWRKGSLCNKWCWESWAATCKSMKLEHSFTWYKTINSRWSKDLNIRHDTIKLLEENIDKTFLNINHSNIFFNQSPNAKEIKAKINKQGLIKLKSFCTAKEMTGKTKRQLREWKCLEKDKYYMILLICGV